MSRGFGSTFGAGATDTIVGPNNCQPPSLHSYSFWIYENGLGGSSGGVPICFFDGANFFGFFTAAATWHYGVHFSVTDPEWTIVKPSPAAGWHHLCLTYDGSSTANKPTIYIDGVPVTVTVAIAASGVYTLGNLTPPVVGNLSAGGAFNWDGMLALMGYWEGVVLSAAEAAALAGGVNPRTIQPMYQKFGSNFDGYETLEPCYDNGTGMFAALTGTRLGTSNPNADFGYETDAFDNAVTTPPAPGAGTILPFPWMYTTGNMQDMTGGMRG